MNLEGIVTEATVRFILDLKKRIEILEARDIRDIPVVPERLTYTGTWDPASLLTGATTFTSVTVTGAAVGDPAIASLTTLINNTMDLWAHVVSANTVRVMLKNETAGTVNIASGTLNVHVWKA